MALASRAPRPEVPPRTHARLLLAPIGAGADEPRLVAGPDAIVTALTAQRLADLPRERIAPPPDLAAALEASDDYARHYHLLDVRAVSDALAPRVATSVRAGELPIVLGGDHTVAIGGFAGVRQALGAGCRLGIAWIDAHPDLNTPETTPSNHGHGMPLAALLGRGHRLLVEAGGIRGPKLQPGEVALIGTRSIDPGEALYLAEHPELLVVSAADLRQRGLEAALEPVLAWAQGLDALYLSFDLDAVDPGDAPGVTTPVAGGLTAEEGVETTRRLAASGKLVAADVVEHLPARDVGGRTSRLAARIVECLLERR